MSNSEDFVNKGEIGESSKKLKRKFKTMKGYESDESVMFEFILRGFAEKYNSYDECPQRSKNGVKRDALVYSRSLKMLLDIISKMTRKLEDEKIKRNDKGKEKFPNGKLTHVGLEHVYVFVSCVVLCLLIASRSQEHLEGNPLEAWISALEQGGNDLGEHM
ncbi:hypothetical protein Tco_0640431 [Tanacetum coccineum]